MTNIDTPDYQVGVVNAQSLLANVTDTTFAVVGVPPNTETLVVAFKAVELTVIVTAAGSVSGYIYPQRTIPSFDGGDLWITTYVDVSQAIDSTIDISISDSLVTQWYVYSDSAAHAVVVLGTRSDTLGQQYVIPSIPGTTAGDSPLTELSVASAAFTANGTLLSSAGGGQRFRIFSGQIAAFSGTGNSYIYDAITGQALIAGNSTGTGQITLPAQGYPLTPDAAIDFAIGSGTGEVLAIVYYTLESV